MITTFRWVERKFDNICKVQLCFNLTFRRSVRISLNSDIEARHLRWYWLQKLCELYSSKVLLKYNSATVTYFLFLRFSTSCWENEFIIRVGGREGYKFISPENTFEFLFCNASCFILSPCNTGLHVLIDVQLKNLLHIVLKRDFKRL